MNPKLSRLKLDTRTVVIHDYNQTEAERNAALLHWIIESKKDGLLWYSHTTNHWGDIHTYTSCGPYTTKYGTFYPVNKSRIDDHLERNILAWVRQREEEMSWFRALLDS